MCSLFIWSMYQVLCVISYTTAGEILNFEIMCTNTILNKLAIRSGIYVHFILQNYLVFFYYRHFLDDEMDKCFFILINDINHRNLQITAKKLIAINYIFLYDILATTISYILILHSIN